jgi:Protein of unknown function (DUF4019)
MSRPVRSTGSQLDKWLAFSFGVIFCGALLYLATSVVNPNPLVIKVYVTVLSLAAAGVGAILPGFLELRYKNILRAGGAIALFVIVYMFEPAIGNRVPHYEAPVAPAEPVVDRFLAAIDTGKPADSWALLSELARQQLDNKESAWEELYKNDLTPLGAEQSRALIGRQSVESPSGSPPGMYEIYTFRSKRADDTGYRVEAVAVRANSERAWEIFSYSISPAPIP